MVDTPFQQPQSLNVRQNRALALAGVFQATQLTHMTAMTGQQSIGESGNFYFEQLIKASLNIRPAVNSSTQTLDFFNQLGDIALGLKTLESSINQPFSPTPKTKIPKMPSAKLPMSYAMALLHLEKKVYSNPEYVAIIEKSQQKILKQLSFLIITIYTPALLQILPKPMSIPQVRLTHGFWYAVMQKHLKMQIIPIAFVPACLPACNLHICGASSVVVHGT